VKSRHGFTLVELLVTMAIVVIVVAGVTQALMGYKTAATMQNYKRIGNTTARTALTLIERNLQRMGHAIQPGLALDFTVFKEGETSCSPVGEVDGNTCVRDSTTAADEIVFYARDPEYWAANVEAPPEGKSWEVSKVDTNVIVLQTAHGGEVFMRGQILQVVCASAAQSVYVTVAATTGPYKDGDIPEIKLKGPTAGNPFEQEILYGAGDPRSCVGDAASRVFLVHRYRYFVKEVLLADGKTLNPYLMLDMGVDRTEDDVVDAADLIPVAPDIVDMQISYMRPEPTVKEVGEDVALVLCKISPPYTVNEVCANGLRIVDFLAFEKATSPDNDFSYFTNENSLSKREGPDAGNVQAVRIMLTARSVAKPSEVEMNVFPKNLNRTDVPDPSGYVYTVAESVIPTRNMLSHLLSYL
jgi:prepilin-type N-terminal cleavage/methylation domain-containing protein